MNKSDPISKISNGAMKTTLLAVREIAQLTRDVGMPVTAFASGIVLLFNGVSGISETGVAVGLIILGLLSQMWIYARENPAKRSDELIDHLREVTEMARVLSDNKQKEERTIARLSSPESDI
jgi:hypothetical protein